MEKERKKAREMMMIYPWKEPPPRDF